MIRRRPNQYSRYSATRGSDLRFRTRLIRSIGPRRPKKRIARNPAWLSFNVRPKRKSERMNALDNQVSREVAKSATAAGVLRGFAPSREPLPQFRQRDSVVFHGKAGHFITAVINRAQPPNQYSHYSATRGLGSRFRTTLLRPGGPRHPKRRLVRNSRVAGTFGKEITRT